MKGKKEKKRKKNGKKISVCYTGVFLYNSYSFYSIDLCDVAVPPISFKQ